ncbi:calmodulin-like protein containing EF hand domain [Diplonema papillatum]|nr:calmodulin-like protein containing EF hand domain [Diplonema papillatum]
MPFCINVAADVYGKKHNLAFSFPLCPGMTELVNSIESIFDVKARASRPGKSADVPFKIQALQMFDPDAKRWADVHSTSQMSDNCQVFCFQPDSVWHTDAPGVIPGPKGSTTWISCHSTIRGSTDAGNPPTLTEKLRSVFHDLDLRNKGCIQYTDLREGLSKADIEFTLCSSSEVFKAADSNGDGRITYEEWVQFALENADLVDALFFRFKDASMPRLTWHGTSSTESAQSVQLSREVELSTLQAEAAWARDRVSALREFEDSKRQGDIARLKASAAEQREAIRKEDFLAAVMS